MAVREKNNSRIEMLDWLKGCAIIAVVLDHLKILPEPCVIWSVNLFVLVTAFVYSQPGYIFTIQKLFLKIFQLLYLTALAVLLIKFLNILLNISNPQPVLSVFLNPYAFFVQNHYLGDIWYIALHLQFIVLFSAGLKCRVFEKPVSLFTVALLINIGTIILTERIGRFHTILAASWLVFLVAGFYGMRPLLRVVRDFEHPRLLTGGIALGVLLSLYGLYPLFPELFTNSHRAFFINLPFYAALVLFLAESYYLLEDLKAGRILKSTVHLLGRQSLAIYLTHEAFEFFWRRVFSSSLLAAVLCILSGIAFGIIAERLFLKITALPARFQNPLTCAPQSFPAA